ARGEPDVGQDRARRLGELPLPPRRRPEPEAVARVSLDGERDVVERRELAKDARDLVRASETTPGARERRQRGHALAREADRAGVRPELTGELTDQRGLACAVRADDRVRLRGLDVE